MHWWLLPGRNLAQDPVGSYRILERNRILSGSCARFPPGLGWISAFHMHLWLLVEVFAFHMHWWLLSLKCHPSPRPIPPLVTPWLNFCIPYTLVTPWLKFPTLLIAHTILHGSLTPEWHVSREDQPCQGTQDERFHVQQAVDSWAGSLFCEWR